MAADARHPPRVPEAAGAEVGARGLLMAWKRSRNAVALAVLLALVGYWWLSMVALGTPQDWAFDFRQFWQGGHDLVSGASPYPSAELLATAGDHLDPEGIRDVFRFPYPAGALVLLAPFGLLGFSTAAAAWSAFLILSLLAGVWLLGVRDWRVVAMIVSSAPVISSVRLGTFTPLLVLLLAAAWRWRDRPLVAGSSVGLAVSLKLFLWPLVVWLLATRRWLEAGVACAGAAALTVGAWAAIGFEGLAGYPDLVRRLADVVAGRGYSLVALGLEAGLPQAVADALPWMVGFPLLVAVVAYGLRGSEPAALALAVVAALALTPIVWLHYFALLIVPLALARPRLAWPWLLLWVFWLTPAQENQGELWRIVAGVFVIGAIAAVSARSMPRKRKLDSVSAV